MSNYDELVKKYEEKFEEEKKQKINEHNQQVMTEIKEREKIIEEHKNNRQTIIKNNVSKMRAEGQIINPFIKNQLEGQIKTARWTLVVTMAITLLFKGFWAMWIIFIIIYIYEVKRYKREALEADLMPWEKGDIK
jgi:dephospho-CoA kinase